MPEQENVKTNETLPKKKTSKRVIIVLIFLAVCLIATFISLRGSYLEIKEIGENYLEVFWTNLKYEYLTIFVNFVILFLAIYFTNKGIKKGLKSFFDDEKKQELKLPNKSIAFIASTVLSIIITKLILNNLMLFQNATWFGINDPVFSQDIGYFFFQKPFIEMILIYLIGLVVGLTIYTALYYIIVFNKFFDGISRETLKQSNFIKKILGSIKIIAVLIAAFVLIKTQDIVYERFITLKNTAQSYYLNGAGLSDVTIKLWGYAILSIIIVISVFMAVKFFKKGQTKKVIMSALAVPTYLVGLFIIMIIFDLAFVKTNELDKQKTFISENIKNTKNAYNINVDEVSLTNSGTITKEEIDEYKNVLNSIPIVNSDVTIKELNNTQTSKGYYLYENTQIAQYKINNEDKLVYVTPREIISNEKGRTYNNKTYEYTHGYGTIITAATEAEETGNISYIQKSFTGEENKINIEEPRIYFGMQTDNTVVTNATNKAEFDYPILDSKIAENAENTYTGTAGQNLNFIDKLILSMKVGDINLAFSGNINDQSKILTNRNIIERAKKIMPNLVYDENPYLVVNDEGNLIWVLDAYTISNNYPYSQRTFIKVDGKKQEINYIRNSVKVLIDSYNGTVDFYITDKTDPIIIAYKNIYPNLFKEASLPEDITKHLVYSEYLYNIQAEILKRYHNVQPDVLYREDDVWTVGTHNIGKTATKIGTKIEPYYTMMKLSDTEKGIFGLVLPYTPDGKQNLISYLVGTYEENQSNGKLKIYKYTADSSVLGPMQLDTQIDQDEKISKEIANLNVTGTKITRNMIMVPTGDTVLYVEPIYQTYINEPTISPVLKKIVVASGNKVAIGNNLKEALTNLISQYAEIEIENTEEIDGLIDAIIKANTNLETSSQNNDWEMIGKDLQKLQSLIVKLDTLKKEQEKTTTVNSNNTINNLTINTEISNNNM